MKDLGINLKNQKLEGGLYQIQELTAKLNFASERKLFGMKLQKIECNKLRKQNFVYNEPVVMTKWSFFSNEFTENK